MMTLKNSNLVDQLRVRKIRKSLAVQWLGLNAFTAMVARVPSLVRELRSRKPMGGAKQRKEKILFDFYLFLRQCLSFLYVVFLLPSDLPPPLHTLT